MATSQESPDGATHAFDECDDIYGGGCNGSRDNNLLILSLYLIDSDDDILHHNTNNNNNNVDDVKKRARLYQRLCQACNIANDNYYNLRLTPQTMTIIITTTQNNKSSDDSTETANDKKHSRYIGCNKTSKA